MPPPSSSQPAVDWIQVLAEVEETLRRTEAAAAEREQAIGSASAASDPEETHRCDLQQNLQRVEEQIRAWPTVLERAEKDACEADALLQAGEEALRRWLDHAQALERRLAKWGDHEVS